MVFGLIEPYSNDKPLINPDNLRVTGKGHLGTVEGHGDQLEKLTAFINQAIPIIEGDHPEMAAKLERYLKELHETFFGLLSVQATELLINGYGEILPPQIQENASTLIYGKGQPTDFLKKSIPPLKINA